MAYRMPKAIRCGPKLVVFLILLLACVVLYYLFSQDSNKRYNPYILRHLPENSEYIYSSLSYSHHYTDLQSDTPFLTVHYLWCQKDKRNVFEHRHYLGIMSVLKQIHPDQIFFHYEDLPLSENEVVNWIKDLKRDVAILNFRPIRSANLCSAKIPDLEMNGIFVESGVIVTNLSRANVISLLGFCRKSKNSCVKDNLYPPPGRLLLTSSKSTEFMEYVKVLNCQPFNQINNEKLLPECVSSDNQFKITDIQQGDNSFHKSMRQILYGQPESVKPLSSSSSIPLYGHIVSETFTPKVYISILSAVTYGKITTIFYHGTELPYGTYWDKLKATGVKIHFVEVDSKTFPNTKLALYQYSFYILLQYGGILFTERVIWQKELSSYLLKFDTVGTTLPFEGDTKLFNLDVLMAKPGALFLQNILAISQQLGYQSNDMLINYAAHHMYDLYPKYVHLHTNLIEFLKCDSVCSVDHETLAIVDKNLIITDEESYNKILNF